MIWVKGETIQTRKYFGFDRKLDDTGLFFSDIHHLDLENRFFSPHSLIVHFRINPDDLIKLF